MPFGVDRFDAEPLLHSWVDALEVEEVPLPLHLLSGVRGYLAPLLAQVPIIRRYQPGFVLQVKFLLSWDEVLTERLDTDNFCCRSLLASHGGTNKTAHKSPNGASSSLNGACLKNGPIHSDIPWPCRRKHWTVCCLERLSPFLVVSAGRRYYEYTTTTLLFVGIECSPGIYVICMCTVLDS